MDLHIDAKKKGTTAERDGAANPIIEPIFILERDEHSTSDIFSILVKIDEQFRSVTDDDITGMHATAKKTFLRFRNSLLSKYSSEKNKLIIPLGINYNQEVTSLFLKNIKAIDLNKLKKVEQYLRDFYDYVYIPKDIDTEQFMKLETKQVQVLMGETLEDILRNKIKDSTIREINRELDNFIKSLEIELEGYVYKTIQHRQSKVKRDDIYQLIIDTYFSVRKLHKKIKTDQFIKISEMSSGEKQKAIIDVSHGLLKNHRETGKNLILAIDEPEASLHISSCFEQFNSLFDIGNDCRQVLFTSHWYGYLPMLSNGTTCIISKSDKEHRFDLINTNNYQEELSHMIKNSKGELPYDIQLKSITDFIQSILINLFSHNCYNWIICEGGSEKIYFEKYFSDEIKNRKLKIVPVGGASKVKKIYEHIVTPYLEMSKNFGRKYGKILFISDTDKELVKYEKCNILHDDSNLECKRLLNNNDKTELVYVDAAKVAPETEIEDCLNGKAVFDTLKTFIDEYPILNKIIDLNKVYSETVASHSLNLRPSEHNELKKFFDLNQGEMKITFAKKYCDIIESGNYVIPKWIDDIRIWINSPR